MATMVSEKALQKATGRPWQEWFDYLKNLNAQELPHREIAEKLQETAGVTSWWAQAITVEYERKIGRREVGQGCEGDFHASGSKTLPGTLEQVFLLWQKFTHETDHFNQVSITDNPHIRKTPNWRYWRVSLEDGSRLSIMITQKTEDKVLLAVSHEKISDAKAVERWKTFWKTRLQEFQLWLAE